MITMPITLDELSRTIQSDVLNESKLNYRDLFYSESEVKELKQDLEDYKNMLNSRGKDVENLTKQFFINENLKSEMNKKITAIRARFNRS